jgi:uncharacterized membrane protein YqaE (UPF0057 family)
MTENITMRTPVLLAALLAASAILLSACGHSYRFVPAYSEQSGSGSVSQEAQSPAATDAGDRSAEESRNPNLSASEKRTAESSGMNQNTAPVEGSRIPADRHAAFAARPDRPAAHEPGLNAKRAPSGPSSMSAVEVNDKHVTAAAAQAAPAPRGTGGVPKWFLIVCCIFLPPLAVALVYGITDKFWIDLLLTLCFWIPGVIYALIQVL